MQTLTFLFHLKPVKKLVFIFLIAMISHSNAPAQSATNVACGSQSLCPGAGGCMSINYLAWSTSTYATVKYYYTIEKSGTGTINTSPMILKGSNTNMNVSFTDYATSAGLYRVTVHVYGYDGSSTLVRSEQASSNYVNFYYYTPGITAKINGLATDAPHVCQNEPINFTDIVPVCISTNEYFLGLREANSDWTVFGPEKTQWISGALPSSVDMRAFSTAPVSGQPNITLIPGHYYRMVFAVGPTWYSTAKLVYIKPATPGLEINNATVPPSSGVFTICSSQLNSAVTATSTSCESKYFVAVEESDQWWNRTFANEWTQWFSGTAPLLQLQALTTVYSAPSSTPGLNNYGGTTTGAFTLSGGTLTTGPSTGLDRYWRLTIATGEPNWQSITTLIRVDNACRTINGASGLLNDQGEIDLSAFLPVKGDYSKNPKDVDKSNLFEQPELKVYPNPVSENLNVALHLKENCKHLQMILYDLTGKPVKELLTTGPLNKDHYNYSFDLHALTPGMYYLRAQTDHNQLSEKVVVTNR